MKITTEQFISEAKKIHNNEYNYSKVECENKTKKVTIICPKHGEFKQSYIQHVKLGHGCSKCGKDKLSKLYRKNTDDIIKKFKEVHGDKYDYSKVDYVNMHKNVCIICQKHGEFQQTPHSHIKGHGCKECYRESKNGNPTYKDTFIENAKIIHKNKYDYSKVVYVNNRTLVDIICPIHGIFQQTPGNHINGCGCKDCGIESRRKKQKLSTEEFVKRARKIHGDKYDYSKSIYSGWLTEIEIICPKHGPFSQTPREHLDGCGCQKCGVKISKPEEIIYKLVNTAFTETIRNSRKIIPPLELDIYIPEKNTAIEYNGLRWHTEEFGKDKNYHLNKLEKCKKRGIKLIQIFEDEFLKNEELVINKLKHILNLSNNLPKIAGRKCFINETNHGIAEVFLEKYHIQGFSKSSVYLGAFYEDKLVAVMTFKEEIKNSGKWELTRFASDYNYICQGVGGKLFKYFIKNYNPEEIKSFADRRWTTDEENNIYIKLGFKFDSYTRADYKYYKQEDGTIRQHKFNFRKQILHKKYNLPLTMTESEMTKVLGYHKIWNCGLIKYIWKKNKELIK